MRVIASDPYNPAATTPSTTCWPGRRRVGARRAHPETLGLLGAEQFARMKPRSVYLNSARAGLHDLDALTDALASGHLGGAGLDHFEGETLPVDHPLCRMGNVVLTPHIGGATYDTEANHTTLLAEDLRRLVHGERPRHCANPEVLP
jgi:D-3-phosphoglycerate dehydrogenase